MEMKYSKFEINMWDIFFLVIYLSHLSGGIDILFNKKEREKVLKKIVKFGDKLYGNEIFKV